MQKYKIENENKKKHFPTERGKDYQYITFIY